MKKLAQDFVDQIFTGKLIVYPDSENERRKIIYYGDVFEAKIGGNVEKIRPFIGYYLGKKHHPLLYASFVSETGYTDSITQIISDTGIFHPSKKCLSKDPDIHFSENIQREGINHPCFKELKKVLSILYKVKEVDKNTLEYTYSSTAGAFVFSFFGVKKATFDETKGMFKIKKAFQLRVSFLVGLVITCVLLILFNKWIALGSLYIWLMSLPFRKR